MKWFWDRDKELREEAHDEVTARLDELESRQDEDRARLAHLAKELEVITRWKESQQQ